jgi:hypothetical protein
MDRGDRLNEDQGRRFASRIVAFFLVIASFEDREGDDDSRYTSE